MFPSIEHIETVINVPASRWVGHCHLIANELLKQGLVKGRLCYGSYHGAIDPESFFSGYTMPHHGWIQLDDGRICDPTRWVFENVDPYLFIGEDTNEEYDFGNNKLKEMMMSPAPKHNPDSRQIELDSADGLLLQHLLNVDRDVICIEEAMWVATLPLSILNNYAKPVFQFLTDKGLSAFIPIDNREYILE